MQIHQSTQNKVEKKPSLDKSKVSKKVYLDSAATKSLFCDEELLDDVRGSYFRTEIQTNTGTGQVTKEGDVPGFKTVMFSEKVIANLLALNEVCEKYHVTFDSKKENAFNVKLNDGRVMKFSCDKEGMYLYSPGEHEEQVETHHVQLESDHSQVKFERVHNEEVGPRIRNVNNRRRKGRNKIYVEGYTRREVERAARARRMYHSLTAPDIAELKKFIRQNIMQNFPVTTEDIILAEKIFGRDVPTLKGKSANRQRFGTQHTIRFRVDDILSSHLNAKVNDKFLKEPNQFYGKLKPGTSKRGDEHEFLGMTLKYKRNGTLEVRMDTHINDFVETCSGLDQNSGVTPTPAAKNLFNIDSKSELLNKKEREEFHPCVAKGLYIGKRSRPDIQMPIVVLLSRVTKPNQSDLQKLVRIAKYLKGTKKLCLTLGIDDVRILKWMVDSSHAVHDDFKGHTGGCLSWGIGSPISISQKQKLNSRSSTESEIIGVDDVMDKVLWTKLFLQAQGVEIRDNILYQDNQSSIKLETNGKWSSGKRTRAINIRYFFVTDNVEKGNLQIQYKPSEDMVADFLTKPLQGKKFVEFRAKLMGFQKNVHEGDGVPSPNLIRKSKIVS